MQTIALMTIWQLWLLSSLNSRKELNLEKWVIFIFLQKFLFIKYILDTGYEIKEFTTEIYISKGALSDNEIITTRDGEATNAD